jgi:hypothetical protein
MAIEKLSVILELVSGNYNKEARTSAQATGEIGGAAKSVTGSLGAMLGPAAIGGAVVGLTKMALAAGENADRLFDLSSQTGLSTDALQEWEFVAAAAGASGEVFSDAVKAIIKNLDGSAGATGAAAKAYETLGISVKDTNGDLRDAGDITSEVFEKLAGMTNITERNALAQDLFGKKWEETISILDLGSDALSDLREEGKKAVISPESLRNADKFRETFEKIKATLQAKLFDVLGKIAPILEDVAEAAGDALDELQPLIDGLGWLADQYTNLKDKGSEMAESDNIIVAGWGRMIGEIGILDVLTGNYSRVLEAGLTPAENYAAANVEIHDSWGNMIAHGPLVTAVVEGQGTAFSNAAKAADTQRRALINLFTAEADLLDPVRSVLLLQKESIEANKRLADARADSKTSTEELALAVIEAAQAEDRLNAAGAALSAEQVQTFAQTLISDLGMSEDQALDTLAALGLLDGWHGSATFSLAFEVLNESLLDVIKATSGTGISNTTIQVRAGGGPYRRGSPYLVGEDGPELMVPGESGMVIPNSQLGGMWSQSIVNHKTGPTIIMQSSGNAAVDAQLATIMATVTTLVEVQN